GEALHVRHATQHAGALLRYHAEQQPWYRVRVSRAAIDHRADDSAAADGLPRGAGVVDAHDAVTLSVFRELRRRRDEDPARAVPAVDLHALRVRLKNELASHRRAQSLATVQVRSEAGTSRGKWRESL